MINRKTSSKYFALGAIATTITFSVVTVSTKEEAIKINEKIESFNNLK